MRRVRKLITAILTAALGILLLGGIAASKPPVAPKIHPHEATRAESEAVALAVGLNPTEYKYIRKPADSNKLERKDSSMSEARQAFYATLEEGDHYPWTFEHPQGKEFVMVTRKPDGSYKSMKFVLKDSGWTPSPDK